MKEDRQNLIKQIFADNRAEWATDEFEELFVPPRYLTKLELRSPCMLIGGRGTGKTTSLQSLRYDAVLKRLEKRGLSFDDQEYLGILVRVNKNRVHAFQSNNVQTEIWQKYFAHYFNLLVCLELCDLAAWLQHQQNITISAEDLDLLITVFKLENIYSLSELKTSLKKELSKLELQINNPQEKFSITLSIAEMPIKTFVETLENCGLLNGRMVFCCIDEYENLLDAQQAVLNTYIKHAMPPISYKIGVRKNGFRNRQTLNVNDMLSTPDDYREIEITEEDFDSFAKEVAENRLQKARKNNISVPEKLSDFLESLSLSEEAELLGAKDIANEVLAEIEKDGREDLYNFLLGKEIVDVFTLKFWKQILETSLVDLIEDWRKNEKKWRTRLENYRYPSLFWLSKGRKGTRTYKYYCGERVYLMMAGGNIRYFLELIDKAVEFALEERHANDDKEFTVSAKAQTNAAKVVGERRLDQLEGLADQGVQLKRLVLTIGKIFFELARIPNSTPEVISFLLTGNETDQQRLKKILANGVGYLAFESSPATKATGSGDIREEEYRLHRIFSAFFAISHRKKRCKDLESGTLLGVYDGTKPPSEAINAILKGVAQSDDESLPKQLAFFSDFYGACNGS